MVSFSRIIFRTARACRLDTVGRRLRPGAVVLCYHNVVLGTEVGADRALHMPAEALRSQLEWLARRFSVVSIDELRTRATSGRSLRGLAAVTFDDAYRGTITHGRAVLRALGIPGMVFVPTASPTNGLPFWWDLVPRDGVLGDAGRKRALSVLAGDRDAILSAFPSDGVTVPHDCLPARWAELSAAQDDGFLFEAHSVSHRTLPQLGDDELVSELRGAADDIECHLGRRPAWVAYPYGLWNENVAAASRACGYRGGFTLAGRDVTPQTDWSQAARLNVPAGIPFEAFVAWVSGFAHWRASRSGTA
jgi:peptidoglycan/xylan/chitin deacetylase (PgdA/CDA1 family)